MPTPIARRQLRSMEVDAKVVEREEEEKKEEEEEPEEENNCDKSNNPHLAGREIEAYKKYIIICYMNHMISDIYQAFYILIVFLQNKPGSSSGSFLTLEWAEKEAIYQCCLQRKVQRSQRVQLTTY